jgi:5-methylcytosine-specific restriction enzyme subunit McrC
MVENLLYEYKPITNDKLKQHILKNKNLHSYFTEKWGEIKPKNYCGIIHIDGEDYYILPKISGSGEKDRDSFIYMLMISYDLKLQNEDLSTSSNQTHKIIEVFIQLFTKTLLKELQHGLFKQYITYQENLKVLRGKYLINENLKYNFTKDKIYCEFDEFSPDNTLNQFFVYAIRIFSKHTKNKKALKMCEMILDEVSYTYIDLNKLDISFDRLNIRYKKSFEIAQMILKRYIPLLSQDKQSFAFLFDMNELFENFVGKLVPDAKLQNQRTFGNLVLKPDILLDDLIIDTKYKKLSKRSDLSAADKYQMFAYGKNFDIKNTMLLYPKYVDNVCENLVLGKDEDSINLAMRSLDLEFNGGYEEFVCEMKKRVEEIVV